MHWLLLLGACNAADRCGAMLAMWVTGGVAESSHRECRAAKTHVLGEQHSACCSQRTCFMAARDTLDEPFRPHTISHSHC